MEGRTTLLIAHRLSTINLADRVAYLEDGRIVATGAHDDLLRTEPRYARVLAQLAAREAEEAARAAAEEEELKVAERISIGAGDAAAVEPPIEPDWRMQ
jgi:ABC-type multidrug transport system ATPase subunit